MDASRRLTGVCFSTLSRSPRGFWSLWPVRPVERFSLVQQRLKRLHQRRMSLACASADGLKSWS